MITRIIVNKETLFLLSRIVRQSLLMERLFGITKNLPETSSFEKCAVMSARGGIGLPGSNEVE